jgi:hypothetical protein
MINGERGALRFCSTSAAGSRFSTVKLHKLSFRTINIEYEAADQTFRKYVALIGKRSLLLGLPQK